MTAAVVDPVGRKSSIICSPWILLTRAKITILIMGAINSDGIEFLDDLGRHVTQVTDDNREKAFLYQRLSVVIQCNNAAILGTFAHATHEDTF